MQCEYFTVTPLRLEPGFRILHKVAVFYNFCLKGLLSLVRWDPEPGEFLYANKLLFQHANIYLPTNSQAFTFCLL